MTSNVKTLTTFTNYILVVKIPMKILQIMLKMNIVYL